MINNYIKWSKETQELPLSICSTDRGCDVHARYLIGLRQVRITRHVLGSKGSRGWDWGVVTQFSILGSGIDDQIHKPHSQRQDSAAALTAFN